MINDALLNTVSGSITVGEHAFFGHEVALLTGTHDVSRTGHYRQLAVPTDGRDIIIETGAWIASRAIIVGPCRIGANAVVAPGAVVNADVPSGAIVAGIPARLVGRVGAPSALPPTIQLMTDVGTLSAHPHDKVILRICASMDVGRRMIASCWMQSSHQEQSQSTSVPTSAI